MDIDPSNDLREEYGGRTVASVRSDAGAIDALAKRLNRSEAAVRAALRDVHGKTLLRNLFSHELSVPDGEPVEDSDEEGSTGVEKESDDEGPIQPYNPDKIRVDPKSFSLKQILDEIADGGIDLAPDFQRNRVWSAKQRVRLVESVLLRIPLPAFYFSADQFGRLSVVDGVQRLSTIEGFVTGKFPLRRDSLEYLDIATLKKAGSSDDAESCHFDNLDSQWRRRLNQTQITANVIDPQTPEQVKFDIFKRINTGGSPLNAQEIRHSMMRTRSRNFLKALAESQPFLEATPSAIHYHRRMTDREVVLRYLAFALLGDVRLYPSDQTMDEFLMTAARRLDDESQVTDDQLKTLRIDFENSMRCATQVFGNRAFRKWPQNKDRQFPFNKALFESWGLALRFLSPTAIASSKAFIVSEVRRLMTEREYNDSITISTGDARNVRTRFEAAMKIVTESGR